jgi:hypothetical protein
MLRLKQTLADKMKDLCLLEKGGDHLSVEQCEIQIGQIQDKIKNFGIDELPSFVECDDQSESNRSVNTPDSKKLKRKISELELEIASIESRLADAINSGQYDEDGLGKINTVVLKKKIKLKQMKDKLSRMESPNAAEIKHLNSQISIVNKQIAELNTKKDGLEEKVRGLSGGTSTLATQASLESLTALNEMDDGNENDHVRLYDLRKARRQQYLEQYGREAWE